MSGMQFLECVDLCEDVYKENNKGKNVEDHRFDSKCAIIKFSDSANPTSTSDYTTITFRGTASINNWVNNLYVNSLVTYRLSDYFQNIDFLPRHDLDGHQGFFSMASRLYNNIKENITENEILRIYGHSLGGALATIIAYCLSYEGYNVSLLVTIGCPRVFQIGTIVTPEASYKEVVPNYYRLMNEDDIVTFLPLNTVDKTYINYDFENKKDTDLSVNGLWQLVIAGASTSIGKEFVFNKVVNSIFHNVKNFRHVGNGIILSSDTFKQIGLEDIGRNVDDITVDIYYKYLSLIFTTPIINSIATSLGIGLGANNFATVIEDITSNQWILNSVRVFTFNWKEISYSMTNNLFEQDPFYKKLIKLYGDDHKIKPYLPLLDFGRGRRRFFGKILPEYYKTVSGFIYTKLQDFKQFSDKTETIKFKIVDEIMDDWINNDFLLIGKNKQKSKEFYKIVRNNLLRKFVGNDKTRAGGLRARLGFIGTNFKEQQTRTIIFATCLSMLYFLAYSIIMYRMTYKGAYDHQIIIYRNNIMKNKSTNDPLQVDNVANVSQPKVLSFCLVDESEMGNVILI